MNLRLSSAIPKLRKPHNYGNGSSGRQRCGCGCSEISREEGSNRHTKKLDYWGGRREENLPLKTSFDAGHQWFHFCAPCQFVTIRKPVLNAKVNGGLGIRYSNQGRRGHGNTLPRSQKEQNGDGRRYKKKKLKNCWPGKLFRVIPLLIMVNGS